LKEPDEHRAFLNRYYGISRHFYDLTRKYYLFGRDAALEQLLREDWTSLIEVGVGTGRNLRKLQRRRPGSLLGGIDASDEMLVHARKQCPWATLQHGFAEDAALKSVLDAAPQRVLFSYSLSMVEDPVAALRNARKSLARDGEAVIVDFADLRGLAGPLRAGLLQWLRTFHVNPVDLRLLGNDAEITFGPLGYFFIARVRRLEDSE